MTSFPETYKSLNTNVVVRGDYKIIPIRFQDRAVIMEWRNEQIYHLRQSEPLTPDKQDWYFKNVVASLFEKKQPDQLLFSFLYKGECIGYGGVVHINWTDKNAEVSFIMKTSLEKVYFQQYWTTFLELLDQIAFQDLALHKLFTYAFDIRPHLYPALEKAGFEREAILKEHCFFNGVFKDVVIHSRLNRKILLRRATIHDLEITYSWAKNPSVREYAINKNQILKHDHDVWFAGKISDPNCVYLIAMNCDIEVGSMRFDLDESGFALISYLIDPKFHGKGLGKALLKAGIEKARSIDKITTLKGLVKVDNNASVHIFNQLGFEKSLEKDGLYRFQLKIK